MGRLGIVAGEVQVFADDVGRVYGDGGDVTDVYDNEDANANAYKTSLATGDATHVPVHLIGVGINGVDLGANGIDLSGVTQPHHLVIDLDRDSALGFAYSGDDVGVIYMELGNGTTRQHIIPDVASDTFAMLAATQTLSGKTLTGPDGDAAAPTYAFTNGTNDGMYLTAGGGLGFSVNGAVRMDLNGDSTLDLKSNASGGIVNIGNAGNDWTANNLALANANSGGSNQIQVRNTSDTAGSFARMNIASGGASAGDALVLMEIIGTINWGYGIDNSNSDQWVIGPNNVLGDNDALRITTGSPPVIAFNTTQGADFDYVCETCGAGNGQPFICHGAPAVWHDDVTALALALGSIGRNGRLTGREPGIQHLAQLGVLNISQSNDGSPWIGLNMVSAQWYTWASIYQNRQRIEEDKADILAQIEDLRQRLLRIGG